MPDRFRNPVGNGEADRIASTALRYPLPWRLGLTALVAVARGRSRSFRHDASPCLQRAGFPLSILGSEQIPTHGPRVLTANHYHRVGFGAWWIALAISATVPAEVRWSMTAAWTEDGTQRSALLARLSRRIFPRVAGVYGFDAMPPMPPRAYEVAARAAGVRAVLRAARAQPPPIIGLTPEGQDHAGGGLMRPHPGVGRFMLHLADLGHPFQAVGVYEEAGALCLSFGEPYRLAVAPGQRSAATDRAAAEIVMRALAAQLPSGLRGEFG